jgi:outer membrane protein assembly factor BamE
MHKLLISIAAAATLTGCSGMGKVTSSFSGAGDVVTDALNSWSLLYRADVQQGNVVTQEMMDKVQLGMDKRQVRYALGTPVLVDVFHQDRWDYVYTRGKGSKPVEFRRTAMIFEGERLVRIEGDLQPRPASERPEARKEVLLDVPDHEPVDRPFFERALDTVGLSKDD